MARPPRRATVFPDPAGLARREDRRANRERSSRSAEPAAQSHVAFFVLPGPRTTCEGVSRESRRLMHSPAEPQGNALSHRGGATNLARRAKTVGRSGPADPPRALAEARRDSPRSMNSPVFRALLLRPIRSREFRRRPRRRSAPLILLQRPDGS